MEVTDEGKAVITGTEERPTHALRRTGETHLRPEVQRRGSPKTWDNEEERPTRGLGQRRDNPIAWATEERPS